MSFGNKEPIVKSLLLSVASAGLVASVEPVDGTVWQCRNFSDNRGSPGVRSLPVWFNIL